MRGGLWREETPGNRAGVRAIARLFTLSRQRRGLSALLSGALALATTSCGQDTATRDDGQSSGVEVTDSGGVTTVALGRVENLSPPQLTPTLVYSTLQSDIPLFRVTAAILLDGGGVALANSGAREVLLLAADGSLDNRAGGPGEGPGEFGEITTMVKALDGFLVYDARMGRMNEFTDSGDFVTSWSFGSGSRIVDLKPLARGIDEETLNLSVYRTDGTRTRRIHGDGGGVAVSPGDVSAWRSEQLAEAAGLPPEFVEIVENVPYNETFPAFETAVLGPGETVWIALRARPGDETRAWLVIGPDGRRAGVI